MLIAGGLLLTTIIAAFVALFIFEYGAAATFQGMGVGCAISGLVILSIYMIVSGINA